MHLMTTEGKSPVELVYKRREEVIREETMRVIAPDDKRRQVASGGRWCIRGEKRLYEKRTDNESDCTW